MPPGFEGSNPSPPTIVNLRDNFNNSINLFRQNKSRAILTMLGIVIGIMGVIVIISAGNGAQGLIVNQIQSQGSNLIAVFPGSGDEEGPPVSVMGIVITTLKYNDIKALKDPILSPHVEDVTGYVRGTDTVTFGSNKADTTFIGVSASLPNIEDTGVALGSFFGEEDERGLQKVAVLGSDVKKDLFGDDDPLGQLVKIGKHSFRVIGVMRERGTSGFANQDNQIYVPITTAQKLLLGINYINFGRAKIKDNVDIDKAIDDIKLILRDRHDLAFGQPNDFDIRSQKDAINILLKVTNAIKFFLAAVAGIALLVGGIGIMNIMLVAVQERIREIGLRKAVGARNFDIMEQFLVETILITSAAGIIGIILGVMVSYLIAQIMQLLKFDWDFSVSIFSVILSVVVSSVIGLVFGIVPARRASKLNSIEALRYE